MRYSVLSLGVLAALSTNINAANWPAWRGDGTGVSADKKLPVNWGTNENVRWRVPLPERANSSPIVWGNRVFVAQAVSGENRRTLMCFDRKDGKLLWQSGVTYAEREQTQRDNPYCSATPATDGERVIASFGSAGLYCYDFAGKELWHRDFGKMNHAFGNGSSPVIIGDLCVFNFGPDQKARLIAVNKKTGETVWEAEPPKVDPSEQQMNFAGRGGQGGGPGGPGGGDGPRGGGQARGAGGGGGGFGLGTTLGPQMVAQADKNTDAKVTKEEWTAVADLWFDKLDPEKTDKVTRDQFAERFYDAVPPRDNPGDNAGGNNPPQRRRSQTTGPTVFAAADTDKNEALNRSELKSTFAKWFDQWDSEKSGSLAAEKITEGLNAALPRPQFAGGGQGGPGGGAGGRGGGGGGMGGGSWSTPLVIKTSAGDQLIMNFPNRLAAYDVKTGKQIWLSKGLGSTIYTTPVWGAGTIVGMTSGPGGGGAIAVKPGGEGDVTESQRVWRLERVKGSIGSGVIHDGHLFTISQDGIATCLDLKDGKTVWEERLKGSGSRGGSWSSMLLADGKIYVPNQSGDVFVLRAAPKFELLATNSVAESTNASLAASDGEVFMRTDKALWCFAAK